MRWVLGVVLILAAVAGLTLGVLNPETASLDLGFLQISLSLGAMVSLAAGLGLLSGLLLAPILFSVRAGKQQARTSSGKSMVIEKDSSLNG